eukprot:snap_masked-scaffold_43-processed-gene-1.61-mRNA-1 protein AED:1.00 eAED:1.00 QI:0/0/0/0/1/1/2/0/95
MTPYILARIAKFFFVLFLLCLPLKFYEISQWQFVEFASYGISPIGIMEVQPSNNTTVIRSFTEENRTKTDKTTCLHKITECRDKVMMFSGLAQTV